MEGQTCWDMYSCIWKLILEWFVAGEIETRYPSFLAKESKCMPQGGMEGVCMVVISCVQPDGWKITSANPNGDQFIEWRRLFFGVGLFVYAKVTMTCRWLVTVTQSLYISLRLI